MGLSSSFFLVDRSGWRFLSQGFAGLRAGLPVWHGLEKVILEVGPGQPGNWDSRPSRRLGVAGGAVCPR